MNENTRWYEVVDRLQTLDEIYSVATEAKQQRSECDWVMGELASRAISAPGASRQEASLKHFSGCVNESYGKIKDACRVARKINREMREEFMSLEYGHWREIVKRVGGDSEIRYWAERAADEGLTVSKLRKLLSGDPPVDYKKIAQSTARNLGVLASDIEMAAQDCEEYFEELREAIRTFERTCETRDSLQNGV